MRDRFVCFQTKRGHWFVIDRDAETAVFDTNHETIARDFCADRNVATGGRAVAPKIDCLRCYGLGYLADPDGRQSPEPCDCRWPTPEAAAQAHTERLAFFDAMHGRPW